MSAQQKNRKFMPPKTRRNASTHWYPEGSIARFINWGKNVFAWI